MRPKGLSAISRGIKVLVVLGTIIFSVSMAVPVGAQEKMDYTAMVNQIETYLGQSLASYKQGNADKAKEKLQAAYFEVFENLEGPIRVNISPRKNFELEEEFVGLRRRILAGEDAQGIEKRVVALLAELRKVAAALEGGFELRAEATQQETPGTQKLPAPNIEAMWLEALSRLQFRLKAALDVYQAGQPKKARDLVVQAQFDGYKNSLLETAIRRYVSPARDYQNNAAFPEIAQMMRNGRPPEGVRRRMAQLVKAIKQDLPGLPAVEGAKAPAGNASQAPEKDWRQVTDDLFSEIHQAFALYERGDRKAAMRRVQDAYFDVFEASGMEAKIGARDAGVKARLENHFSMLVAQMKGEAQAEAVYKTIATMKRDFDQAANLLARTAETPAALFFYSLMIILREGFEAILIITAIVAYLIKTGNRSKLGVIYNGALSALVLSVMTAVLMKWVLAVSAASQEIIEGATMLLAAAVLFTVSYWLISRAEAQKWMAYIKDKVSNSLSSGSMKALWFAAFLAVYREGAETVLFYQALVTGVGAKGVPGIAGGFALGSALLVGIYLVMRYGTVRLPIRPFFIVTGGLLYFMAFVFTGQGVMELIAGRVIEPSSIAWVPAVPFVGVYPYWQTVIPQVLLLLAALAGTALIRRQIKTRPPRMP